MHCWGDEWFTKYGDSFYKAIHKLESRMRSWAKVGISGKEKWGTYRDEYLALWDGGITQLFFGYRATYQYNPISRTLYRIDHYLIPIHKTKYGWRRVGLANLNRLLPALGDYFYGYDEEKVRVFRENILRDVVPVVSRLRTENAKRLGVENYMLYDDGVFLPGGDPKPFGKEEIFAAAREMYHAMGAETGAFIDMMLENEAFDVDSRKNKWGGGYCTEFPKFRQPFILANFNGTAGDVDVVTHEAGHALNAYLIADNRFALDLGCGGMETAETHSMSMEFFAWPYMEKFFGGDAGRYCFMHALEALSFLPYGTMVDAFQHLVYENPDMTPAERDEVWLELEKQFRPHISMAGMPYLEKGTRWQYQMHIYESPFYYIDYCLAQTAAFCFLLKSREDYDDAFARYLRLSRQGGEKVWTDLLEEAGFPSPFEPGALKTLSERVEALLEQIRV